MNKPISEMGIDELRDYAIQHIPNQKMCARHRPYLFDEIRNGKAPHSCNYPECPVTNFRIELDQEGEKLCWDGGDCKYFKIDAEISKRWDELKGPI